MTMMNRRRALTLMGSGTALAIPAGLAEAATPAEVRFDHGVASGDPASDGAILWTRATPAEDGAAVDIALTWHVAPIGGGDAAQAPQHLRLTPTPGAGRDDAVAFAGAFERQAGAFENLVAARHRVTSPPA